MARPLIFISYRRRGAAPGYAGRLHHDLQRRYGDTRVFLDVAAIEGGRDFHDELSDALRSCVAFLAVIGPDWASVTDETGGRRLEDPADYVRREVEIAIERGIHLFPVLIQGAAMPARTDLPTSIQALAGRQALELSDSRWAYDVHRLMRALTTAGVRESWSQILWRSRNGKSGVVTRMGRNVLVATLGAILVLTWYSLAFPGMRLTPPAYAVAVLVGGLASLAIDWARNRLVRRARPD